MGKARDGPPCPLKLDAHNSDSSSVWEGLLPAQMGRLWPGKKAGKGELGPKS